MFTGIVETLGEVVSLEKQGSNLHISIRSDISNQLKVDQSVLHNGICLTVIKVDGDVHMINAVEETLSKTDMRDWKPGDTLNIERAMSANGRFDGHLVQGHVDTITTCSRHNQLNGSWEFYFDLNPLESTLLVDKGSICINGVSLTIASISDKEFHVAVIPYTFEHTTFKHLQKGDPV
ncbi:MAG: riboflavin synthase, partial [Bacteroidetes bacterium]|nr:riboflavin synthase [Bacteroidota bacterium]